MRAFALVMLLGLGTSCLEATPITFEIENDTGAALSVQQVGLESQQPGWLRIFDENSVEVGHAPAFCACPCGASLCSLECAVSIPETRLLEAGEVEIFEWDGLGRSSARGCIDERPVVVTSVEMCIGESIEDETSGGQILNVNTRRCERFDVDSEAQTVRHTFQ